ncbi:MAG TPA: hypothetical protein VFR10_04330 [bacterium]|nr:hypothetical protein [bacterium]
MLPNSKLQAWSMTVLVAAWSVRDAEACTCPPVECEWVRFEDPTPHAPDFWWKREHVLMDQIRVCPHAVRFEFLVKEKGVMMRAALVFPRPDEQLIETRLGIPRSTPKFASELRHFSKRYESLVAELNKMFNVAPGQFLSLDFGAKEANECPTLFPAEKLALEWQGHELLLRGYLDVYFATAD